MSTDLTPEQIEATENAVCACGRRIPCRHCPDLAELRRIAEAVPEWNITGNTIWVTDHDPSDPTGQTPMQQPVGGAEGPWLEHIATFDPPTVLDLLDRLEAAEAALRLAENVTPKLALLARAKSRIDLADLDAARAANERLKAENKSLSDHADVIDGVNTEIAADRDAARATLAKVRELAEEYRKYGTHPTLDPDDGTWAILRADLVAERLLAILDGETSGEGER